MKLKRLSIILAASVMALVGCGNDNPEQTNISLEEFKTAISEGILGTQNYSAHIDTRFEGDEEYFVSFNTYSINDDAIFDDTSTYYYYGYIRQKNQGIVDFQMLKAGQTVFPGEFYATNASMPLHEFYPAAPSNIFASLNSFSKEGANVFKSGDVDAMAVIANLGLGINAMLAMNPDYFYVSLDAEHSTITVNSTFIYNYQSEEPGALPDTFIQVPVYINVVFTSIGTTSFPSIEEYVANPDTVFPTPTAWSESDEAILRSNFNNMVPPFVEGLSYAYELKAKGSGNTFYALLVDYASGDLTASYGASLTGFKKESDSQYQKVVEDDQAKHIYTVDMRFYDPNEVMNPQSGEKWGFCYPNGVFQIKFSYKKVITTEIKNVQDLVSYLDLVDASRFFLFDEVNSASQVKGFSDGTVTANQGEGGDIYHFTAPTGFATFKVYLSYADAVKFGAAEETYLNSCSDLSRSTNTPAHTVMYSTDDSYTVFQFTLMSSFSESSYPGYIEIRVRISHTFYEAHKNDHSEEKIRINYVVLTEEEEDVTAQALKSESVLPLKAEIGSTVNLSAVLNNGYTFVKYEPDEPEESEKTVKAQAEAGTFDVNTSISSFVAPSYDFTMIIRVNELDPSIGRLESISVENITTEYHVGDTYNFDGMVVAHYSNGDQDVTSKAVINDSIVNTSVEDRYDVTVTFTDEYGQTASTVVKIYVRAVETYKINIKQVEGVTVTLVYPTPESSVSQADYVVRFKVTEGESLLHGIKVFTVSGSEVAVDYSTGITGKQYYFTMPAEEVVITPIKESSVDTLVGSYSIYIPMNTKGYYNKYTLTFNDDGTGTYSRDWHNASPSTYTLYFSYTVSGSNITVKLEGFKDGASNISFQAGYRLFVSSQVEDPEVPEFENLNPTGVRNNRYCITFSLVDANGDIANTVDFYRE